MRISALFCTILVVLATLVSTLPVRAATADQDTPEYWKPAQQTLTDLAPGVLVWESRRTGTWQIWTMNLDGSGVRQLSPKEPDRDQVAPHISPDGKRVTYLSYPAQVSDWGPGELAGQPVPLHMVNIDGTNDHVIVPDAVKYEWDRAVTWFNDNELAYIGRDNDTYRLNLTTGESTLIYKHRVQDEPRWLPNTRLTHMAACFNTFSPFDAKAQSITVLPHLGGCMPFFTQDSKWGFWMRTPGGPIFRMNLATRIISPFVESSIMPRDRDFIYFPMVADNGMLLAFAGAPRDHILGGYGGYVRSDYEIFIIQIDPNTLDLIGKPVRYTFDPACDRFPDVWQAPLALGYHTDKAPFDVSLKPKGKTGDWSWDFGDGATAKGPQGKHAYAAPGIYTVKATQGDVTLSGLVYVKAASLPKALGATVENEREVVVSFSEPVDVKKIKASVGSKAKIERWTLEGEGRMLRLVLAAKPTKDDTLVLDGVTDLAQHPNAMGQTSVDFHPTLWPVNPKGLAFLWQATDKPNTVRDPSTNEVHAYGWEWRDRSWVTHDRIFNLQGGMVTVQGFDRDHLSNAIRQSHQLTFEFTFTPTDLTRDKQAVFSYGFWQKKDKLVFELGGKSFELCTVQPGKPHHIIASYAPGKLVVYLNGAEVLNTDAVKDDLNGYQPPWTITFGNDLDGHTWTGTVEGVAIFDRALTPEEAKAEDDAYRTVMTARKPVTSFEIDGKLLAVSRVPSINEIQPYRRALAVYEYAVQQVTRGKYSDKTIRVAQWVILDNEFQTASHLPIGATAHLVLEPYDANPQLEGERMDDTLPIDPDIPLYFATDMTNAPRYTATAWKLINAPKGTPEGLDTAADIETLANVTKAYTPKEDQQWKTGSPDADNYLNFGSFIPYANVGYAVVYVTSPEERKVTLDVTSIGGVKAWVNGAMTLNVREFGRYPFCSHRRAEVTLHKGENQILLKVTPLYAFWGAGCELLTPDGRAMTDLTYATDPK